LNEGSSKFCFLKDEIDYVRMSLLLLREVNIFHQGNHFHCDIRPENILCFNYFGFPFYMLIDYGSSFKKGEENKRVCTFSQGYTPEDINWNSQSDIYSLGYFFFKKKFKVCFFLIHNRKDPFKSDE
jgi:hypothetical protein